MISAIGLKPQLLVFNGVLLILACLWLYRKYALARMEYTRDFSKQEAFEGETVVMTERIVNRKLLPLPWLRLESAIPSALVFGGRDDLDIRGGKMLQHHLSVFALRPYRQIVRKHHVYCARRGVYRLHTASMTSGDPFGIVPRSIQVPLQLSLTVFPRPVRWTELPLPSRSWLGEIAVRRWTNEDPFRNAGVRSYQSGDSLNAIHWKATARTGTLQAHKKDYTADRRLMIVMNLETSETMWKTVTNTARVELGIRWAAAIAHVAADSGIEVGFLCNGWQDGKPGVPIRLEPHSGEVQRYRLLRTMAGIELEAIAAMKDLLLEDIRHNRTAVEYVIISCHQGKLLSETAQQAKEAGSDIHWLLIPEAEGAV